MKTVAFVPIRLNSKRVIGKNLKKLGNKPLLCYVLDTLVRVTSIDEVYVFCSSDEILPFLPEGVRWLKRSEDLDRDETLGREIYDAFVSQVDADLYVLTHTTSPFIKPETIEIAINQIKEYHFDSALSVEKIQTFTWFKNKPLNYQLDFVPRTQDLEPIFIETSAFFMFKKQVWAEKQQRIGNNPYFAVVDKVEGIDIDTPQDFAFAEQIIKISK